MPASYPTAAKIFTSRNAGDVISQAHVNDLQDEVSAIESGLLGGTAPLVSSNASVHNLTVSGAFTSTAAGLPLAITSVSTNYVVLAADDIVLQGSTVSTSTVTLLTAVGRLRPVIVKNTSTGIVTLLATGGQTIDGSTSQSLSGKDSLTLVSDQSNWLLV